MASHPTFDANQLDTIGDSLSQDEASPLLNRAVQGQYPARLALQPFFQAAFGDGANASDAQKADLFAKLGFYSAPTASMPAPAAARPDTVDNLRISPLQMALAAAALSHEGIRPAPQLALAVETATQGWVVFPPAGEAATALDSAQVEKITRQLASPGNPIWEFSSTQSDANSAIAWYLAGTLANWQGTPLALVVALEEGDPSLARLIGRGVLKQATQP
jgi:hypothetical protein